jgi:ATP-dependent Zn protease
MRKDRKRNYRGVNPRHIAYHEAGHAVIGLKLGCVVRSATIRPRYSSLGSADVQPEGAVDAGTAMIKVDLAGPLAERLVSPHSFFDLINRGSRTDWLSAWKAARRDDDVILDLIHETRALVQQNREAIVRVAAALLERETLTGDDLCSLMGDAG